MLYDGYQCEYVIADRSYNAADFLQLIMDSEATFVNPPRKNRIEQIEQCEDVHLYRERDLVECFVRMIKHYLRIFSRLEKPVHRFLGFLSFFGTLIWLR